MAIARPGKIVCVGRNYREHAAELGNVVPNEPLLFLKPSTAVIGDGDAIVLPPGYETPTHYHERQEETYFVHQGQVELRLGDGTTHLLQAGMSQMGVVPTIAYDANIFISPGLGTTDENGALQEDRARLAVRALMRLIEVVCNHAGVLSAEPAAVGQ